MQIFLLISYSLKLIFIINCVISNFLQFKGQSKVTSWLFRCTPTSLSSAKKATLLDVPLRVLTGGQAEVDPRGSSDAPGREEVARRKTETGYGVKNKERENEDVSRKRVVEGTSSIPTPKHVRP